MIPLLLTDPIGDDHGLGYAYPRAALFAEAGFADLTGFEALERGQKLVLRVRLHRYPNALNAPHGFSLATVAIYLQENEGGSPNLPGAGFRAPAGQGWHRAYLLTGWTAEERLPDGRAQPVGLEKREDWLEVTPTLPPGDYRYYVAVGIYDPFDPWYFRQVRPGGGAWSLDGPAGAPAAVDVLASSQPQAYSSRVLEPVQAQRPLRLPLALLSAGLGLLMLLLAFRFPHR
ncbi:glucodextranase DOMON-like domain-containing protein [Meiothermus granaticius]|uniref:Glucodextranase-like C-terminal domain-containing protein n=1 Tax=Meiothermus granaticius NBRC 107808 TaxID=1227551 RepID=A0A399F925_9DEIN|nr:glucodextranase DOMON-like domain-containing protein [Meiothermus granaticius]RIH92176.1 hypothetical protein Mgrana_01955 [Meiothermus granaticius NBRC 107808]GEM86579.1 hypothetical protein MGR01S_12040 [Meiothermus granaticius NBRC 107808]